MEPVIAPRRTKRINRKTKLNLIFDEAVRREYLTGFHKRKLQRKKKAEEEFKQKLKEERKRIKEESKAQYKKLVKTFQPIPELEEQLAKEYQVKNSTVSVLELDTDLLAERNFIIGRNRANCEIKNEEDEQNSNDEELPGMELKTKKEVKRELKKKATSTVKKSKVFKKKNRMEQIKQKKKAMNKKKEQEKIKGKKKHKGGHEFKKKLEKGKFSKRK